MIDNISYEQYYILYWENEKNSYMNIVYRIFVLTLCILSLPVLFFVSLAVVLLSGCPIFYRQKRVGLNGAPFIMYKFRTMIQGAEKLQKKYEKKNEAQAPVFKIHDDPRFTSVGKFLSHTGLDELPQLWNVLCGDMALFGPRPLPVSEASLLRSWQRKRECIKPGILSPWVLDGYHKRTFDEWMRDDCAYVQRKDFMYDTKLFFRSVVFMGMLFVRETCKRKRG